MKPRHGALGLAMVTTLLLSFGSPVQAEIAADKAEFEIYAGEYIPDPDILDSDLIFGFRMGFNFTDRFGVLIDLGYASIGGEGQLGVATTGSIDADLTLFDVSAEWFLFPDSRTNLVLFAGIGGAFVNFDAELVGPGPIDRSLRNISDDTFTYHVGSALRFDLGTSTFLKLDARARVMNDRDDDDTDTAVTLAFGWKVG